MKNGDIVRKFIVKSDKHLSQICKKEGWLRGYHVSDTFPANMAARYFSPAQCEYGGDDYILVFEAEEK